MSFPALADDASIREPFQRRRLWPWLAVLIPALAVGASLLLGGPRVPSAVDESDEGPAHMVILAPAAPAAIDPPAVLALAPIELQAAASRPRRVAGPAQAPRRVTRPLTSPSTPARAAPEPQDDPNELAAAAGLTSRSRH